MRPDNPFNSSGFMIPDQRDPEGFYEVTLGLPMRQAETFVRARYGQLFNGPFEPTLLECGDKGDRLIYGKYYLNGLDGRAFLVGARARAMALEDARPIIYGWHTIPIGDAQGGAPTHFIQVGASLEATPWVRDTKDHQFAVSLMDFEDDPRLFPEDPPVCGLVLDAVAEGGNVLRVLTTMTENQNLSYRERQISDAFAHHLNEALCLYGWTRRSPDGRFFGIDVRVFKSLTTEHVLSLLDGIVYDHFYGPFDKSSELFSIVDIHMRPVEGVGYE